MTLDVCYNLNSNVISVSLGTTRKFQFSKLGKKHVTDELILNSGDVVHMHGPRGMQVSCQRIYEHRVPPMSITDLVQHIKQNNIPIPEGRKTYESLSRIISKHNIPPTRINLTFRQFED